MWSSFGLTRLISCVKKPLVTLIFEQVLNSVKISDPSFSVPTNMQPTFQAYIVGHHDGEQGFIGGINGHIERSCLK